MRAEPGCVPNALPVFYGVHSHACAKISNNYIPLALRDPTTTAAQQIPTPAHHLAAAAAAAAAEPRHAGEGGLSPGAIVESELFNPGFLLYY